MWRSGFAEIWGRMVYECGLDRIVEFVKYDAGDANCVRFWHDK